MFRRNVGWQEKRVGKKRKEGRERKIQHCPGCCIKQPSQASIRTLTKWGSVLSGVCSAPRHLIVWPWLRWTLFLKEMGKLEPWCFNSKVSSEVINNPEVGFGHKGGYFLGSPQRCQKQRRSLERRAFGRKMTWAESTGRKVWGDVMEEKKEISLNSLPITARLLPVRNDTFWTAWPAVL